jgi:hypothetical protein
MLDKGRADVDAVDKSGASTLYDAVQHGNAAPITALLARGPCKDLRTNRGESVQEISTASAQLRRPTSY